MYRVGLMPVNLTMLPCSEVEQAAAWPVVAFTMMSYGVLSPDDLLSPM